MKRRSSGVSINGTKLRIGNHCLYHDVFAGPTRFGMIVDMFTGTDDSMDEFVLFQIDNKPITTYMDFYCTSTGVARSTKYVLWTQMEWKCITFPMAAEIIALPYASCTSHEQMEFRR
jgi:hypothetical protein